jgi:hypothetical protein
MLRAVYTMSALLLQQALDVSQVDESLLALSLVGQLALLLVAGRSRLYRCFPIFYAYIVFSSVVDLAVITHFRQISERGYAAGYFSDTLAEFLFQIGILIEVARNVVVPVRRSLPRIAVPVFLGMLLGAVILAALLSRNSEPAAIDRWSHYVVHLGFAVAILRIAIFAGIAGFSQLLGIGWKNHVLQIATGFLVYSIAALTVELLHRITGFADNSLFHLQEQCRIVVWCMVLGYWSYSLSKIEGTRKEFSPKMAEFLVSLGETARIHRNASSLWYRK